ncbi:MAG: radical SAM family heme chaperone HemW [Bacteroidota bacterium]
MAGLYLHIPFCKQACHYCNFHFATSLQQKPELLDAMQLELNGRASQWKDQTFETIYFGGGTPSLLDTSDIQALLGTIHQQYTVHPDPEITLEANPDDIDTDTLDKWKQLGINRLSLGIQSFSESDLRWMNRAHNAEQAKRSLRSAIEYFPNLTADLIYGTPGLTNEQWLQHIDTLIQLGVPHISGYALTIEPKTPLEKQIRLKQKPTTDPDQQAQQFRLLIDRLRQAGFEHYEISNFAKPGYRSRHNSSYWKGIPYLGIGPSAHSFQPPVRSWQIANNRQYIERMRNEQWSFETESLTPAQQVNERIMISLRTQEGLSLAQIPTAIQEQWTPLLNQYVAQQWILLSTDNIQLTDAGKLHADGIAAALFVEETDQIN